MHNLDLQIESLERRRMMAGNVNAKVVGGDLRVTGDGKANELVVRTESSVNGYLIEGLNGTTINGDSLFVAENVTDDLRISLRGGDDAFALIDNHSIGPSQATSPDDITVLGGGGDDVIVVWIDEARDDVIVRSGGGEDSVSVQVDVADEILVDTSGGDDYVTLGLLDEATTAQVRTAAGNDVVLLAGIQWNDPIELNLGPGDDVAVSFNSDFNAGLVVEGGSGDDGYFDVVAPFETTYGGASGPNLKSVEQHRTLPSDVSLAVLDIWSHRVASFERMGVFVLSL